LLSKKIAQSMQSSSWIRKMFEEGARLRLQHGADAVQDFSLGNPVLEPPAKVREALVHAADPGMPGAHRYMPNAGYPEVRAAVARYLADRTGLPMEAKHVVMCVGAGGGLNVVMKTLLDPGDEVILLTPYFVEYDFYVDNHGGVPVHVPTGADFQLDLAAIEAAITPRTKALLLNSPNNPCGVVYPRASLDALGNLLRTASRRFGHAISIVTDEPYRHISYGVDVPWVFRSYEHVVLVTSHSKDLALPGERIGYIAFDPRLEDVDLLIAGATFATRTLGFVNAPAIQQRAVATLQGFTVDPEIYRRKRDRLYSALRGFGYECVEPQGAFYMFPKTPIADDVAFVKLLLEELILVVPGTGFGRPGHMRISYCVEDATIDRALPGFERAIRRARG
jgi:aspartate aminotransferase